MRLPSGENELELSVMDADCGSEALVVQMDAVDYNLRGPGEQRAASGGVLIAGTLVHPWSPQ